MSGEVARFLTGPNLMFLLQGAATTLLITAAGCAVGLAVGFGLAVMRTGAGAWPARALAGLYVEVFRRVPFLVTLMIVFFAGQALPWDVPLLAVGVVAVCLIASAYLSEVVRAGLESVHPNQWDSAAVANLTRWQALRHVVLPQAWPVMLPPAFAFFLMFLKDSALASQIGIVELTYVGRVFNNKGFSPILSFGSILLVYFAVSYPLTCLGQRLERRLADRRRGAR